MLLFYIIVSNKNNTTTTTLKGKDLVIVKTAIIISKEIMQNVMIDTD